ncbi:MAG: selenocysteine-specific elongation factor [Verrucomicrobiales bacterium]|jgi:selenocysteine-specific elongation factor
MTRKHFIVGTAGHIDHGKSTLVEALTGTDPDRLPEEKARGMTIDLGFAHLDIPDPGEAEVIYSLGVVDVPGHADFVKNMVAGVGSIDLALIVVAADDQWMPQTEEHVQIIQYLGVTRAVVALTKSDLVDDPTDAILAVQETLSGTVFENAPVVPVSAIGGDGLDDLKGVIAEILREVEPSPDIGKPRLHVDRAFSPRGVGTVVTGTLTGGTLTKGEAAVIQPWGEKTTTRNLQSHSANVDVAYPGMRTAVNLTDVGVTKHERKRVVRGDVVTLPSLGKPSDVLDVYIERSSREIPTQPAAAKPMKNGQRVRWHHGGASHSARVYFYGKRSLLPGQSGFAQLRFDYPVYAFYGDGYVIRDWPKTSSLAGGVVLDTAPTGKEFRSSEQTVFLNARAEAPGDLSVAVTTLLERDHAVAKDGLLAQAPFSERAIAEVLRMLEDSGKIEGVEGWLVNRTWWAEVLGDMAGMIKGYHQSHRDEGGMSLSELRKTIEDRLPSATLFDVLVDALCSGNFQRLGKAVRHQDHKPTLPPELRDAGDRLLKELNRVPLEPPNPKELAPSSDDQKALRFLIEMGEIIDLGDKCALLAEAFEQAKASVITYLTANEKATVSDLRQAIGTTRRVLMPILDRLDKQGVTVRSADFRMLSRSYLRQQGS